jgi:hypothetical protein
MGDEPWRRFRRIERNDPEIERRDLPSQASLMRAHSAAPMGTKAPPELTWLDRREPLLASESACYSRYQAPPAPLGRRW